jgi:hypothetical protein
VRVSAAATVAAGGNLVFLRAIGGGWEGRLVTELLVVGTGFAFSIAVGALVMKLLRVEELGAVEEILRAVRRRLGA